MFENKLLQFEIVVFGSNFPLVKRVSNKRKFSKVIHMETKTNVVKVNVGGTVFMSTRALLKGKFFDSLFESPKDTDENGV